MTETAPRRTAGAWCCPRPWLWAVCLLAAVCWGVPVFSSRVEAAVGGAGSGVVTNVMELKVGDPFPDLRDFPLDGKLPAALQGNVVVVDFWASWCAPCQRTFPVMEDLYLRFRKQGLLILAINVDKSRVAMEEFLKEHPVTFHVVRDSKRELVSRLRLPSLPCSFVIDREGKIRSISTGLFSAAAKKQQVKLIEELLGKPAVGGEPSVGGKKP